MVAVTRTNPLSYLGEQLGELKAKGTYFHLRVLDDEQAPVCHFDGKSVINLASNNYLGLTTHPKLREAAATAPAELILAETDSPYLTPMPHRGKPNTPAMVAHTLRCLADVKQIGIEDMCALVTATGERVFGPW